MTSAEDTPARLARIEAMLQTLLERTPAPRPKAAPGPDHSDKVAAFIATWNQSCGGLAKASAAKPGTKRYRDILACLLMEPDLARWASAIRGLSRSRFHKGENERGWAATIDFLIQANQRQKWVDFLPAYAPPPAVVPRVVRCVRCGAQATVGPGTGQAQLSPEALCPGCFGGK